MNIYIKWVVMILFFIIIFKAILCMSKKSQVILTVIFTILSLIWIILSYCGIIRYYTIKKSNIDNYIEKYKLLDKADSNNKVVIHIVKSDNNVNLLNTVKSLLDQNIRVDEISITLHKDSNYKLPDELTKIVNVYYTIKEYNKESSIIPLILREKETNTRIILVNDNVIYGKDYIEDIINLSNLNPDSGIICDNNLVYFKIDFYKPSVVDDIITDNNWMITQLPKKVTLIYNENFKI